jgi:hypothetical protein
MVADSPGHAGFDVPGHRPMMVPAAVGGHDQIEIPAQDLLSGVAEYFFRCFVEEEDFLLPVNGDKGFIGVFNSALQDSELINVIVLVFHFRCQHPQRDEEQPFGFLK